MLPFLQCLLPCARAIRFFAYLSRCSLSSKGLSLSQLFLAMHTLFESSRAVVYIVYLFIVSSIEGTCYYPDKSVVTGYQPCNATVADGVYSACCAEGDGCSTSGYCLGGSGFAYRGGCTDENWTSESCCPSCRSGTGRFPKWHHLR